MLKQNIATGFKPEKCLVNTDFTVSFCLFCFVLLFFKIRVGQESLTKIQSVSIRMFLVSCHCYRERLSQWFHIISGFPASIFQSCMNFSQNPSFHLEYSL